MADLEKLTVNVSPVDLGQIELLVAQGFYANRAEFIRMAIHDQLAKHSETVRAATVRQSMVVGAVVYDRQSLEKARDLGQRLAIKVVGLLVLPDEVTPELARETIETIVVHGVFKASDAVKRALLDRHRNE